MKHVTAISILILISLALPAMTPVPQDSAADIDALFRKAKSDIHRRDWAEAARGFNRLVTLLPRGDRQAECFYWHAYALNRMNGDAEKSLKNRARAASLLETMLRRYPASPWSHQARALMIDVSSSLAQSGLLRFDKKIRELSVQLKDLDLKLLALDSLMETDLQSATAGLKNILKSRENPEKRRMALLIISRRNTPGVQKALLEIIRDETDTGLRRTALARLVDMAPRKGLEELERILKSKEDKTDIQWVLPLFLQLKDGNRYLFRIAGDTDLSASVRSRALILLAQGGKPGMEREISDLYPDFKSPGDRRNVATALGFFQTKAAAAALIRLYKSEKNVDVRKAIILALGRTQQENARRFLQELLDQ